MRRVAIAALVALAPAACAQGGRDWGFGVPLIEVPAAGHTMALVISGDGGWASGDRGMAEELSREGVAVVGLDSRAYLRAGHRTPDSVARDVTNLLDHYEREWNKDTVLLVGYSRGADLLPFALTRMTTTERSAVKLLGLVSLSERANFTFHWEDIVRDVRRADDIPTAPEVARLAGMKVVCLGGEDEHDSGCRLLDPRVATITTHAGGHSMSGDTGRAVARQLLAEAKRP